MTHIYYSQTRRTVKVQRLNHRATAQTSGVRVRVSEKNIEQERVEFFFSLPLSDKFLKKKYHRYCAKSSRMLRSRLGLFHMSVLLFCGAGREKRRGEQLKWSLAFRLYIGRSPCAQLPGPVHTAGTAECVFKHLA